MLDIAGSGLIGSLVGGVFRLAPELLKFFDRKDERVHEYRMFTLQTDLEKLKGQFRMEEAYVDYSTEQLKAIQEAFKEQADTSKASYPWVAAASALVRPGVTYILFGLYCLLKLTTMIYALIGGAPWLEVIRNAWSADDFGMLNMILTFWFVGRAIEKYQK